MTSNAENNRVGWFRFITPVLVGIAILMLQGVEKRLDVINNDLSFKIEDVKKNLGGQIKDVDDKMFKHLTNDDMHSPRSLMITKAEFQIYQGLRQQQMSDMATSLNTRIDGLRGTLEKVITTLEEHSRESRRQ